MQGKYSFTSNGREYTFEKKDDYFKALENMCRVESRREAAGDYVTEELTLADTYKEYGFGDDVSPSSRINE